ncbi:hypothetical protein F4212_07995 [Candidatus Poribacteria bacterium]|nr:hypothetical protein [Candidatus Poribacteria bacterium]
MSDQLEHSDGKNARFLELYKFHSQQATELSNRRTTTNRFFILLLSGIAVAYTTLFQIDDKTQFLPFITNNIKYLPFIFGLIGLTLSWVWLMSIESNLLTSTRKYKVLKHMERHLDYEYFTNEWALLGVDKKDKTYRSLAITEIITPIIFIIIFTILYGFSLWYLSFTYNLPLLLFSTLLGLASIYLYFVQPTEMLYLWLFTLWYIPIIPWIGYFIYIYCYQKIGSVTKDSK